MTRSSEPGWLPVGAPDGRRGVWVRETDDLEVEFCAGREGDDEHARLAPGAALDAATMVALRAIAARAAWSRELAESDRASVSARAEADGTFAQCLELADRLDEARRDGLAECARLRAENDGLRARLAGTEARRG